MLTEVQRSLFVGQFAIEVWIPGRDTILSEMGEDILRIIYNNGDHSMFEQQIKIMYKLPKVNIVPPRIMFFMGL